jgi:serine/threonine protein kinase
MSNGMHTPPPIDEALLQRLPLPLAKLLRRAQNSKTSLERHLAAFYLWEAGLKLLGSVAVVEFAHLREHDAEIRERLQFLARPSLGHWWEFCRRLVPVFAAAEDPGFAEVRKVLLGKSRDNLPWAAGLDSALRQAIEGSSGARATVRLSELFDRLVQYRNREIGHGAAGQRGEAFYQSMGRALLSGVPDVLACVDVLAGRRLIYVTDVRRQVSGRWLVEREELTGETAKRLPSVEFADAALLPHPQRVYAEQAARGADATPVWRSLHPLVLYEPERGETFFLNGCHGRQQAEYLSYQSGEVIKRRELESEQRELLASILGAPVDHETLDRWAEQCVVEDPSGEESAAGPRRTIGEYEILGRIGRGGMGVVYRAWQPSLGREVALKCLLRTGDAKAEARFAREIRALGRVDHPHVVKVFTSGSEGDQWFYTEELIDGADLDAVCRHLASSAPGAITETTWRAAITTACDERLQRAESTPDAAELPHQSESKAVANESDQPSAAKGEPLPGLVSRGNGSYVHQVVELLRQAAEAAHALHGAGVVHRDIKPANIMLDRQGERAVLMDLGLAQLADETEGKLTRTRQFVGTLRYASPEQVLAAGPVDCRTDVYSLGATLWELLTLRPMFGATEETSTPELMRRIQYEEPERLKRHNPAIPTDLEAIVARCLEKNPDHRYSTAQELADDLERWQQNKPVHARPLTLRYVSGKFLRRNRRRIAAVAAFLLLQAAVITLALMSLALMYLYPSAESEKPGLAEIDPVRALREGDFDAYNEWVNRHNAEVTRANLETERIREAERLMHDTETVEAPADPPIGPDFHVVDDPVKAAAERAVSGSRKALLVGVSYYPEFPRNMSQLAGVENDLKLLQGVLRRTFAFDDNSMVVLGETAGGMEYWPTHANIEREVRKLAEEARAGDQLLVFLSGNGTHDPSAPRAENSGEKLRGAVTMAEPSRAAFFPRDATMTDANREATNPLTSVEFAEWIRPAIESGASLWVIYDACNGGFGADAALLDRESLPAGVAFTYAAQADEETPEERLPRGDPDAQVHGLFTYTLCKVLLAAEGPISYLDLVERVDRDYRLSGRQWPAPAIWGDNRERMILGGQPWSTMWQPLTSAAEDSRAVQEALLNSEIIALSGGHAPAQPPAVPLPSPESEPLALSDNAKTATLDEAADKTAQQIAQWLRSKGEDAVSLDASFYPNIYSTASGPGVVLALAQALDREEIQVLRRAKISLSGEIPPRLGLLFLAKNFSGEAESFGSPIGDVASLAVYLGLTTSFPLANESQREDAIMKSWREPTAYISGSRLSASSQTPYSVEVLTDDGREPRVPADSDGMAFVELGQGEPFSVRLMNDSPHDAAVELAINGVNVFALSEVESYRKFGKMIVPAKSAANIRGFYRSSSEQIPFAAILAGEPLAPELPASTAAFGQITAVFSAAWGEDESPPEDEPEPASQSSTGTGPSVQQNYSQVVRRIGVPRAAVTVRWTTK